MKYKKTMFLLIIFIFSHISSCSNPPFSHHVSRHDEYMQSNLPREAFIKIKSKITIKNCVAGICSRRTLSYAGSGFIVGVGERGSFVMTAAHVCRDRDEDANRLLEHKIVDLDGNEHVGITLAYDIQADICLMYATGLTNKRALTVSPNEPKPGDRLYNLAAPAGIFDINMMPILEGFYNGVSSGAAVYSIPAAGGSSGSPVLNSHMQIVGLIHSVHVAFPMITIGPTYEEIKHFIETNVEKYSNL
jgi:S1-C subfamily serine protease